MLTVEAAIRIVRIVAVSSWDIARFPISKREKDRAITRRFFNA